MSNFLLPYRSERVPAVILTTIPVIVDAAAIIPISPGSAPKYSANRGKVGDFEAVELSIATRPAIDSSVRTLDFRI